jgi:hypothetical protein
MKKIEQPCWFFIDKIESHEEVKQKVLEAIASMGTHSMYEENQNISNTDWHLLPQVRRPYWNILVPYLKEYLQKIVDNYMPVPCNYSAHTFWFQQYAKGDSHDIHLHDKCTFSSVYYVDLPEGTSKTTFFLGNQEFEVEVEEGDILTFPSSFLHASKPNPVNGIKTVVAFNSDIEPIQP